MYKLPLSLTLSRFVLGILVPILICIDNYICTLLALVLFILGALSDAADGAIARRKSQQTKFGAFIDPIADKFLVFMVLITLVYRADSWIILAISLVIIAREIFVMSLREWASANGIQDSVKVSSYGKLKAVIQMTGIAILIGAPVISNLYLYEIAIAILSVGALIGLYSGFLYFKQPFKAGVLH